MQSEPRHKTDDNLYLRFWFVQAIALLIAIPFLILAHSWEKNPDSLRAFLSLIAKDIGLAALIAFILNISIEWLNRRRHSKQENELVALIDGSHLKRLTELVAQLREEHKSQLDKFGSELEKKREEQLSQLLTELDKKYDETTRKLLTDVHQAVYKRYIPPDVLKFVDKYLFRQDVMRRNYTCSLRITPLLEPNPENLVNLSFTNSYEVVNLTGNNLNDKNIISTIIDITPGYEEKCCFVSASIDGVEIEREKFLSSITQAKDNSCSQMMIVGKVPADKPVQVVLKYNKVGPRNFSEVICSTVQMDSFTLETVCQDTSLGIFAMSMHPESEKEYPHAYLPELKTWKIEHPIIPGQGIVVFWHPKLPAP